MKVSFKQKAAAEAYVKQLIIPSEPMKPVWNTESVMFGKPPKWNYIDGCMIRAVTMLSEAWDSRELAEYAARFTDSYVTGSGDIPTLCFSDYNLDNVCGGRVLIWLWRKTSGERYLRAAERIYREQLCRQPRTSSGNFWHKGIYPGQVWLDGAYMALPFMAEYAEMNGDEAAAEDVVAQLINISRTMRDSETGLYYHGCDENRNMPWASPDTGLSGEFWLRSIGWLSAGLADVCEILPDRAELKEMLRELLEALAGCMTGDGMLLQLPASKELSDNYPETSGTLLFAYSAMKAARLGAAGDTIRDAGIKAFNAVTEGYITFDGELPVLRNICLVAGLGGEPRRDGSAEYYLSEPVVENDAKGIAPYLMAYTELMKA
jgi:unsaturated rhamnogalacturonyl hydrolase